MADLEALARGVLADAAAGGDWVRWHQTRLEFSDWLEEHNRIMEATVARGDWRPRSHGRYTHRIRGRIDEEGSYRPRRGIAVSRATLWELVIHGNDVCSGADDLVNSVVREPLLHFAPQTLLVRSVSPWLRDEMVELLHRPHHLFADTDHPTRVYPVLTLDVLARHVR